MAIDIIRITATILIFLCHACVESGSAIGGMFGQFFNVGVPIFFLISGYLHSQKPISNTAKWYVRKFKRVCIPLYVFLSLLFIIYVIAKLPIHISVWLQTIFPICGLTQNYISGCGHLWFLTHLLICYLITPLLQRRCVLQKAHIAFMLFAWFAVCSMLAYAVPPIWCTLLNSLFTYVLGYYALPHLLCKSFHFASLFGCVLGACALRLVFHHFFDGTPFYNSVATQISSLLLALSVVLFISKAAGILGAKLNHTMSAHISALSKQTYNFYLTHYIFLNGVLCIKTANYLWSVLIALFLSIVLAKIVSLLSEFIFIRK